MIPPICFGQSIQTGNASAKSTVETNVQGSGSVHTVIQVEANGEKKTQDTTEPGTHTLEINSNTNEVDTSPSATVTPKVKNKVNSKTVKPANNSWFNNFKNRVLNFLKNIGL